MSLKRNRSYARPSIRATASLKPGCYNTSRAYLTFIPPRMRHNFSSLSGVQPKTDTNFESLEIGARLDIGVSMMGGVCQYFVNEITRLYEADFFAEWLSQPGTHICRAVAAALEEVFFLKPTG
jgi:hypothetical protein